MKGILPAVIIAGALIIGAFIFTGSRSDDTTQLVNGDNVSIVDGVQVVTIDARGGYTPRRSVAESGIPTVIRFNTKGTFDCSSAVRIPSLGISKALPQTGVTDIDLGAREVGTLSGSCSMGMYPFSIEFQ